MSVAWWNPRWLLFAALLLPFMLLSSCRSTVSSERTLTADTAPRASVTPARDTGPACGDVGDERVCWNPANGEPTAVVARAVPKRPASLLGWRCAGALGERRCTDRANDAALFRCDAGLCVQRPPRLPDDGEWECADFGGITVCRGTAASAGIPPGASDPAFACGPRRGRAAPDERICVDLSPDFPDGTPRGTRCRFDTMHGLVRSCARDEAAHTVTNPCDRAHPCISGLDCVDARCVPVRPRAECWVDTDCDNAVCRFGTCMKDVP